MVTIAKQSIYLNLRPGSVMPVLHVSQGDSGLEALEFKLINGSQPWPIPAAVTDIQLNGTTPVGVFSYSDPTWSGNTVTANVTETMTAERGLTLCELRFLDSTLNSIGTLNFVIAVEPSPFTNAHVSTSDMAVIIESLNGSQRNMLLSKSWAVGNTGMRDGEDTNNSKYWSEVSDDNGQRWAIGSINGTAVPTTDPAYHNNSKYWSEQSDINGERWSVGQIDGSDVPSSDVTYHNNSKWWSSISKSWAVGGTSNRSGEDTNNSKYYADQSRIEGNGLASVFSDALDYSVGDYAIHDGILYEFTVDHSAGAWNLSDVHVVNMGDEVADLKNSLGFVSPKMYGGIGDGSADDTSAVLQAVSSGLVVNLGELTYRITQSLNLNDVIICNGTLKLIGAARITGSNIDLDNVAFDFTEKTEESQIGVQFTGGTNTVRDCYFSNMTARLFAYQIDASNCNIHVDGCKFGVVRVLEINDTQGDNTGSARHIITDTCDAVIENCVFNGFYGEDNNFFEDSDCIHVTRCNHAVISKNLFRGNWKSAVKNQYANVAVIGNTFLPTKAWYVIRSHTEAKNASITDNIIDGACDVCFYLTSGNNIVCNNHIELSTNQLVDVANAEVIFNDNYVKIESNGGLHRTYNDSELSAFITLPGTSVKIESNSDITCSNHFPYIFARETTQSSVKLTGKIISTGNTSTSVLYDLTGEIRTDRIITVVNSSDLVVHAYNTIASFVNCENIKYYTDKQSIASTINKCTNLHAIVNFIGTTYFADITNSQNIVIELFGTSINANVVAVNDAETTGIAINYINNRQSIYNRNSVTLAYVAKSMLV